MTDLRVENSLDTGSEVDGSKKLKKNFSFQALRRKKEDEGQNGRKSIELYKIYLCFKMH
jgi:hypothetical protein